MFDTLNAQDLKEVNSLLRTTGGQREQKLMGGQGVELAQKETVSVFIISSRVAGKKFPETQVADLEVDFFGKMPTKFKIAEMKFQLQNLIWKLEACET